MPPWIRSDMRSPAIKPRFHPQSFSLGEAAKIALLWTLYSCRSSGQRSQQSGLACHDAKKFVPSAAMDVFDPAVDAVFNGVLADGPCGA